jgi:hypothetical protein
MNALQTIPRLMEARKTLFFRAKATAAKSTVEMMAPALSRFLLSPEIMGAAGESTGAKASMEVSPKINTTSGSQPTKVGLNPATLRAAVPNKGKTRPVTSVQRAGEALCAPPAKNLKMATVPRQKIVSMSTLAHAARMSATVTLSRLTSSTSTAYASTSSDMSVPVCVTRKRAIRLLNPK